MRREAITLVFAMGIGSVLIAACDKPPMPELLKPVAAAPETTDLQQTK